MSDAKVSGSADTAASSRGRATAEAIAIEERVTRVEASILETAMRMKRERERKEGCQKLL